MEKKLQSIIESSVLTYFKDKEDLKLENDNYTIEIKKQDDSNLYLATLNISFLKELSPGFIVKVIHDLGGYVVSKNLTPHSVSITFKFPSKINTPNELASKLEKIIVNSFVF